ncbi:WecB/TagA/CpsF family glycosyltransferase [Photobacterium sp. SDRW27]|uniref:WecB/TagA/CpsF family glycosyltransferase n=1 Tax=Photobacterium obscurum TaxID=2829490 RepID=UPI002244B57A|nr:WecB/TagA/CpsF family glycosyltransferase [Photobacterium obscurum]MCW8328254.1 WecB/TagA/CpsF family glycosyltransferase [Photobacterium obscurum]
MNYSIINAELESKIFGKDTFFSILHSAFLDETIGNPIAVSFVNPFSYSQIDEHIVRSIDYWFSDGALLCRLTNMSRTVPVERLSFDFSSIAGDVFSYANEHDLKVAIIGGNASEIDKCSDYLKQNYPGLKLVYTRDGYFDSAKLPLVSSELLDSEPDIVIAGLGTPLQEQFILDAKSKLNRACLLFTCGGFLTQTASRGDYYHPVIKKLGLRWMQRAVMHKHVRDRLFRDYPKFVCKYLFDLIKKKIGLVK